MESNILNLPNEFLREEYMKQYVSKYGPHPQLGNAGFCGKILNMLEQRGFSKLGDYTKISKSDFLKTKGIGSKAAVIIEEILKEYNLTFKEEESKYKSKEKSYKDGAKTVINMRGLFMTRLCEYAKYIDTRITDDMKLGSINIDLIKIFIDIQSIIINR